MSIAEKTTLRQYLRRVRQHLPSKQRRETTHRTNRYLYRLIRRGQRIGVYWAVGSELNLQDFITTAQQRGALIYLPYIDKDRRRLWFTPCPTHAHRPRPAATSKTQRRKQPNFRMLNAKSRKCPIHAPGARPARRGVPAIPQFTGTKIRAHALQTLIVPLLGIDRHGFRLGQGGGFYDATLAHTSHRLQPQCIGVGFACQQVARLPAERHDQRLHAFVCEQGWHYFRS